jgi:hypothetical protein
MKAIETRTQKIRIEAMMSLLDVESKRTIHNYVKKGLISRHRITAKNVRYSVLPETLRRFQ